jgi:hypothetical protein
MKTMKTMDNGTKTVLASQLLTSRLASRLANHQRMTQHDSRAPMVTVPPPTPITAKNNLGNVIATLDRAMAIMTNDRIHHTPLWSDLHYAKQEAVAALAKL